MKTNYKFRHVIGRPLLMFFSLLILSHTVFSQCTNSSAFGTATAPTNNTPVTITTCAFGGEYSTINSCVAGTSYLFTATGGAGNYITIHQGTPGGTVLGFGFSPITVTCTASGPLYLHYNTNASCGTDGTCHTGTVQCTSCSGPPPLTNDNCANALPLTCGVTVNGSTVGATADAVPTCVTTLSSAPGVWYKLDNVSGSVTLSLCGSGYDTKIGVFTGSCAAPVCVTGNDDFCGLQSQVSFAATLGTTYYVLVTGFSTNSGAFTLLPTCTQIVDPCSSITTTSCATSYTASLTGAGVWSPGSCGFSTPGTEKVYAFTPVNTGVHTLQVTSTSSTEYIDYFIKAGAGSCSSTGWACIDDIFSPSTVSLGTLTSGVTYYILLDAESATSVTQTFQINCPSFDPCSGTTTMACGTSYTASTTGSGIWSPGACGFSTPGTEKIYSFTPTTTGIHTLQVTATNSTYVDYMYKAASGGCSASGWSCIDDIISPQSITFGPLTAGVTYYILYDPEGTGTATQSFQINCLGGSPPPCVASPTSPTNGQSGICPSSTQTLSWPASLGATSYDVYFGTSSTPPFYATTSATSLSVSTPTQGTYYWQIRPVGPGGTASGCNIWSFSKLDATPPVITCPGPVTVSCAALVPATGGATATDNCGVSSVVFVSQAITSQTCANKYTLTRTYRATDVNGNSSTCNQIITVNDVTPPSITCPAGATYSCASQVPAANTSLVSGSDNCTGAVTISFVSDVITNQVCANKYTLTRTYRATDLCQNSSTCTQVFIVDDQTAPVLSGIPNNVTIECTEPIPSLPIVSASDNCTGTVNITFKETSTKSNFSTLCKAYSYVITRTWTAADVCGNKSTKTQTIKVQDTKAPVFTYTPPQFVTVECEEDNVNNDDPIAEDACDNDPSVILDIKYKPNLNGCVGNYTAIYTWTAGDKCGNTSQYTQYFFVVDTEAPEIKCPDNIEVSSEIPVAVSWQQPKASDYCDGLVPTVQILGPPSGSIFQPGSITTIVYSATDLCGNVSTCSFTVKIRSGSGTLEIKDQTDKTAQLESITTIIGKVAVETGNVLYQNEPNPFDNFTSIRFNLLNSDFATLSIMDMNGKEIKRFEGEFSKGVNKVQLENADFPASGMYYYQLKTKDFNDTKKMLYIR